MKVLVLGASGLIGNGIKRVLEKKTSYEVIGTYCKNKLFENKLNYYNFDLLKNDDIYEFIKLQSPQVIINTLGITKHLSVNFTNDDHFKVNTIFPEKILKLSSKIKSILIHISTDCVFDGTQGNYYETSKPDAEDIYGISKAKSEVISEDCIVLRTSTVGREINTSYGLLEWFLKQDKICKGFKNAYFSGITNIELGKIILEYILPERNIKGMFNIGSNKINKYDILKKFSKYYDKNINIIEDYDFKIDRSLNNSKFNNLFSYENESWENMLKDIENY